jgi:hypothetical protein
MTEKQLLTPQQAIAAIPLEDRPEVIEWLRACARREDDTAQRMETANRKIQDPTTAATAKYWRAVAAGHKLLAAQMEQSGLVPVRGRDPVRDDH